MKHMNQIYQSIIEFHYGIHFDLGHKYEQISIECFHSRSCTNLIRVILFLLKTNCE